MNFESLGLSKQLLESLERLHFQVPTPVQEQTIPIIMAGQDVLVSSQTGTGKTGAFGIPIVSDLVNDLEHSALIITPTRELATQVLKTIESFTDRKSGIKAVLLIGGESITKQLNGLKQRPNIIVGTPGRINDHLKRKSLNLANVKFLVLDETDRMLDMGFSIQINDIIKFLPKKRQTLLFSATLPDNIIKLSETYMNKPKRIAVGSSINPIEKIKQEVIRITDDTKYKHLTEQLNKRDGSILIFMRTKYSVERMIKKLNAENYEVDGIYGDLSHNKREQVIRRFREQKFRILVATDIVARGLDIPHIQHVINYDIPECPEDYIHRIGRTGRAGQSGESVSFVSNAEVKKWDAIDCMMNPEKKKPVVARAARSESKKPKGSFFNRRKSSKPKFGGGTAGGNGGGRRKPRK